MFDIEIAKEIVETDPELNIYLCSKLIYLNIKVTTYNCFVILNIAAFKGQRIMFYGYWTWKLGVTRMWNLRNKKGLVCKSRIKSFKNVQRYVI